MKKPFGSKQEFFAHLQPSTEEGAGKWLDIAGLIAPEEKISLLLSDIETGGVGTLEQVEERFAEIYDNYESYEWSWVVKNLEERLDSKITQISTEQVCEFIKQWKIDSADSNNLILKDAKKEFSDSARIGFGSDGDDQVRSADFEAVRGSFDENSFVAEIKNDTAEKTEAADRLLARIAKLR